EERRETRQKQDHLALGIAEQLCGELASRNFLFRAIELVDELHDGRHRGIEMPASMEVFRNALDSLVEFTLNLAGSGGKLARRGSGRSSRALSVALYEPVGTVQEAEDAFHAGILPIELAVRRGGEQGVHTCSIGAETLDHLIRRHHVSLALGHLRAVLDHHALSKHANDRLGVANHAKIAHKACPE